VYIQSGNIGIGGERSFKLGQQEWKFGGVLPVGSMDNAPGRGLRLPPISWFTVFL